MGWLKKFITNPGEALKDVERAVIRPVGGAIETAGRDIDKFVRREVPGGWGTLAALGIGGYGIYNSGLLGSAAATSEASFLAADAAQLAGQGLTEAQIAQTLTAGGADAFLAADAAQLAAQGLGVNQMNGIFSQQTDSPFGGSPTFSVKNALQGARLASGLLSRPQGIQLPSGFGQQSVQPQGNVSYEDLLKLLAKYELRLRRLPWSQTA